MQIKTGHHFSPIKLAKKGRVTSPDASKGLGKKQSHTLLVGGLDGTAFLEDGLLIPINILKNVHML